MTRTHRLFAQFAWICFIGFGCAESHPLEPLTVPRPTLTVLPPTSAGLAVNNEDNPAIMVNLPPYAEQIIAEIRVHGYVIAFSQHISKPTVSADAYGYWRDDSVQGCYIESKLSIPFREQVGTPPAHQHPPIQYGSIRYT